MTIPGTAQDTLASRCLVGAILFRESSNAATNNYVEPIAFFRVPQLKFNEMPASNEASAPLAFNLNWHEEESVQ